MTNREWLNSLSDDEFIKWIYADETYTWNINTGEKVVFSPGCSPCLNEVVRSYISATFRLKQWLEETREEL